jgi:hypothetical protein|tara:strand:+ start:462 stop:2000 length:1539 start_codon:yes stop_codon:yes gene_type:complete
MADTQTTNLNLIKPEPGAAENTWGISLNSNLDDIDAIFASGGTEVNMRFNSANFDDSKQINFGTNDDANIRHDGNNTKFTHTGTGGLYIAADTFCLQNGTHDENFICMADNGAVDLYYDNVKKLETTANGVTISGDMVLNGTDSIKVSAGTTAQRNGSPVNGMFRYNTTTNEFEGYQNNAWGAIGGGGTTVNNNADNRIITGSSTADTLEAETDLTYTGGSGSVGTLEKLSSHLELKAANELMLNAGSDGTINFQDAGSTYARLIQDSNSDVIFSQITSDKDIIFKGVDGSATITALTLDMSEAGKAIFKSNEIEFDNSTNSTQVATIAINDPGNNAGKYLRLKGHSAVRLEGNQIEFYDNSGPLHLLVSGGVSGTSPAFSATAASNTNFTFKTSSGGSQTIAFTIASSGITASGNVTAFSDVRLKDDIKTIEGGLEIVEKLRGVTYKRKDTEKNKENIGVIAQEVEEILPQIVNTADDEMGTKSVDYGKITSVLIEAVKELSARVKELEGK